MKTCHIAVIGSGWRAQCFLRILGFFPERYSICGVVSRSEENRRSIQTQWKLPVFPSLEKLLENNTPDFVLIAVSKGNAAQVIAETAALNLPILAETPPAPDLEGLIRLHEKLPAGAKIQIAEQYFLYPMNQARLSLIHSGRLGPVHYAHISLSHGYHGISMIRKALNRGFAQVSIQASSRWFPSVEGPGRGGFPQQETIKKADHTLAVLDFGDKTGLYDFERNQHRSWVRSSRFLVRGERGEINDNRITWLKDYLTPLSCTLDRVNAGEEENLEGYYLKGITSGENWLYKNPFQQPLSDDDIAMITAVEKMAEYLKGGPSFYSLAEASQDQYLALLVEESARENRLIESEVQCWAPEIQGEGKQA